MSSSEGWPLAWPAMSLPARQEPSGAVLVAVESDRAARGAVRWAASEASARETALRLVRSVRLPFAPLDPRMPVDLWSWTAGLSPAESAVAATRAFLASAAAGARKVDSALTVSTQVLTAALEAHRPIGDALLVVEKRSGIKRLVPPRVVRSPSLGSLDVPTVVVDLSDRATPGPAALRVVVLLSAAADPTQLLDAAFRAALRRGVGLTVLTVPTQRATDAVVAALLDPYQITFPEVDVSVRHVVGSVRDLAIEATGAVLTVAGWPHRGARRADRAATRRLLHALRGPVMLVPAGVPEPGAQVQP